MQKIVVIGSTNTDMVIKADHLPAPGETILGSDFFMNPGGKGANQAVAAARLGGNVTFITKVGNDIFGQQAIQNLENEHIPSTGLLTDPDQPSGVALITVDNAAENCIVVAPGANNTLSQHDIEKLTTEIEAATIVLTQLEIPIETVEYIAEICCKKQIPFILNPAPAQPLSDQLIKNIHILTPNESEMGLLTGIAVNDEHSAQLAARELHNKGIEIIIITMGSRGAYISSPEFKGLIPTFKVNATDTTAAGDTFNGALAVSLANNMPIEQAVRYANYAASITVTRMGAQSSIPYKHEMDHNNELYNV